MRRAGYEVRILAEEGGSFEQNPPTLIEFIRRDLRWCQGNMHIGTSWCCPASAGRRYSRLRDPDVSRLAGLDGPSGAGHRRSGLGRIPRCFIRPLPAWPCS